MTGASGETPPTKGMEREMSQRISLADLTVANDGPVDRVEFARRSAVASKSVQEFTSQTAAPALNALIAVAVADEPENLASAKELADEMVSHAETLLAEVGHFTAMANKT